MNIIDPSWQGHLDIVKDLIRKGAYAEHVNLKNNDCNTALTLRSMITINDIIKETILRETILRYVSVRNVILRERIMNVAHQFYEFAS